MERPRGNPLLADSAAWEHRRGGGRTWWALLISLLLHGGVLYFADDLLSGEPLRTVPAPFLVSLLPPEPEAPAREVAEAAPETTEQTAPTIAEAIPEPVEPTADGDPEAALLAPREPDEIVPEDLEQPPRGDSSRVAHDPPVRVRRDVAGEAVRQLIEEIEAAVPVPRSWDEAGEGEEPAAEQILPRGASAGIEGPLGERGLLYVEYPPCPAWAQEAGIETDVRFRFWVSPAGHVIRVRAIRKSAYPEFESLAREALSRWRFEPLPRGAERDEWGEVPIMWRLRRAMPQGPSR
jgi:periplasmic protein TonB